MSVALLNGLFASIADFAWRAIYRLVFPVARAWWMLRRSQHEGALIATYVDDKMLLLRASYRLSWNFPGGGVNHQEAPEQAARREIQEETGLLVPMLRSIGMIEGIWDGRQDRVHFFELYLNELPALTIDNREIVEARLFSPEELRNIRVTGPVSAYLARKRDRNLQPVPERQGFHEQAWDYETF